MRCSVNSVRQLDWIPLKAMRKTRADRYATTTELAMDIENYLASRPLIAGTGKRCIARESSCGETGHPLASRAFSFSPSLAGAATTARQAVRATCAERKTDAARHRELAAEERSGRRQRQCVGGERFPHRRPPCAADPSNSRGKTSRPEAVDTAAKTVGSKFKDKPVLEAAIRNTLAMTYDALGAIPRRDCRTAKAFDDRKRLLGADHPETLSAMNTLSVLLQSAGELDKAEPLSLEALDCARKSLGNSIRSLTAMSNLAGVLQTQNKFAESESLYRERSGTTCAKYGERSDETIVSMHNVATVLQSQRRNDEAEAIYRKTLVLQRELRR